MTSLFNLSSESIMRCTVFYELHASDLAKAVDQWLVGNPGVEVVSSSAVHDSIGQRHYLYIFYRDNG